MPTYLGYKSRGPGIIKWSEQTKMLNEAIQQAINVRALEREAFDEINQTNVDEINSYELGQNQTFNEYVLRGADDIRAQMYEWNQMAKRGEITRADYKSRMNNVMSDWGIWANTAKNYDKKNEKILERQRTGKGSRLEGEVNKRNAMMADLGNKGFYVNPTTGRVYNAEYDENGVIVNATGAHQMQMPGNLLDDSLNLATSVQEHVENWGDWKTYKKVAGGIETLEGQRQFKEEYERLVESSIDSIVTNPRSIAKILVDNGTGEYYWNEDGSDRDAKIDAKVKREKEIRERVGTLDGWDEKEFRSELEKNYIYIGQDETGTYQPVITDDQYDLARERVRIEFDKQTDMETTFSRNPIGGSSKSGGGASQDDGSEYSTYAIIRKAWETGNAGLMTSNNPNYVFERSSDGYGFNVYPSKYDSNTASYIKASNTPIQTARSADELARFFYKTYKGSTPESQFYSEQRAYNKSQGGGSQPKETLNW